MRFRFWFRKKTKKNVSRSPNIARARGRKRHILKSSLLAWGIFSNRPLTKSSVENQCFYNDNSIIVLAKSNSKNLVTTTPTDRVLTEPIMKIIGGDQSPLKKSGPSGKAYGKIANAKTLRRNNINSRSNSSRKYMVDSFINSPNYDTRRPGDGVNGRFTQSPNIDPMNPGCAGGPNSITVLEQGKSRNTESIENTVKFPDGSSASVPKPDHILSKHGHQFGIEDVDAANTALANNKVGVPTQTRTKISKQNIRSLIQNMNDLIQTGDLELIENYPWPGGMGKAWVDRKTRLFYGIDHEGALRKAYVANPNQIDYLLSLKNNE